ncbi:hypothetical protein ACHEXK_12790 [Limnohabitans sp. DCL3]|uniref:hypothetical protein n=1 Tax=Limnohabitans sp. DCL3 TaxID=3374103 RepID=UPI003A85F2BD
MKELTLIECHRSIPKNAANAPKGLGGLFKQHLLKIMQIVELIEKMTICEGESPSFVASMQRKRPLFKEFL